MGHVCARCADVKKGKGDGAPGLSPTIEESDSDAGHGEDDEVAASSDEEGNDEEYKQGVEEILKSTGKSLKRGKTMAMKEAISTAKKYGIEKVTIEEAESRLDEHKKRQKREETEKDIKAFFDSPACKDTMICERMIKKATEAECSAEVLQKLQDNLDELIMTRDLEEDEIDQAREYLRRSCMTFVLQATKEGGRPVVILDLNNGKKTPAFLSLNPPLQLLKLREDGSADGAGTEVQVSSLSASLAKTDEQFNKKAGLSDEDDRECAVIIRYEDNRRGGQWCCVEPTPARRDRLVEAIKMLTDSVPA